MTKMGRRTFIRGIGATLWLPYLESISVLGSTPAYGQSVGMRKRFVAMAWPQGAAGDKGSKGNWHFDVGGYLRTLSDIRSNLIIPRGFGGGDVAGGYDGSDTTHGNGYSMLTTGYSIRNKQLLLSAPQNARSIDQLIADKVRADNSGVPLHSLVTGVTLEDGGLGFVHGDSGKTISWASSTKPILPIVNMRAMFDKIFIISSEAAANSQKEVARKKSVLDFVKSDLGTIKASVNSGDSIKLDEYLTQIREIEKYIDSNVAKTCSALGSFGSVTANLADINSCNMFLRKSIDLHVIAHQCDLVRTSTITMDTSVSNIGRGDADSYHVHTGAECDNRYHSIIQGHVDTIGYAIRKFKEAGLLDETIIYAGSDCALGHVNVNTPILIAGRGTGFKWGQEVGSVNSLRPISDLLIDMLKAYGINNSDTGNVISWDTVKVGYPYPITSEKSTPSGNSGILS
jgi:hypothetical protein